MEGKDEIFWVLVHVDSHDEMPIRCVPGRDIRCVPIRMTRCRFARRAYFVWLLHSSVGFPFAPSFLSLAESLS